MWYCAISKTIRPKFYNCFKNPFDAYSHAKDRCYSYTKDSIIPFKTPIYKLKTISVYQVKPMTNQIKHKWNMYNVDYIKCKTIKVYKRVFKIC